MKAVVLERHGGPAALAVTERPTPTPECGGLLVAVRACGVCGHDVLARRGELGTPLPRILGHEIAGEVVRGDPAGEFPPGTRVVLGQRVPCLLCERCRAGETHLCRSGPGFYGEDFDGGYAEYVVASPANAVRLPDAVSFASAAALPCGICTGLHALGRIDLRAGETVLITGAAGGVGFNGVALAAQAGATVVGVVRSEPDARAVEQAGAAHAVVSSDGEFADQVRAFAGPVDAAIECVGEPCLGATLGSLRRGGRVAVVGNVRPRAYELALGGLIVREVSVLGSSHARVGELAEAARRAATGQIRPRVARTFALAEASRAHAFVEAGGTRGRVVLVP